MVDELGSGTGHATMIGNVIAMKPADYERWLHDRAEGRVVRRKRVHRGEIHFSVKSFRRRRRQVLIH